MPVSKLKCPKCQIQGGTEGKYRMFLNIRTEPNFYVYNCLTCNVNFSVFREKKVKKKTETPLFGP